MGQQTPSPVVASTLNMQGNIDPSHLQIAGRGNHRRGTPTKMLSVPSVHRPKDFRLGRGESGHRPLFPQPSHSLPHLQDVHSLEGEELGPQRRPLHLHRYIRRLPPHPYPHALPEVPCLHSRRQALLLPSHAIRNKHRTSYILPGCDRGSQTPPQQRNLSLGLHRRLAPLGQIAKNPRTTHIGHGQPSSEVGLHTQPEEVTTGAIPDHHLPGHFMVRHRPHPPPEQQSSGEGLHDGPGSPTAAFSPLEALPETPGLHQLRGTIHRVWAPTPQADHSDLPHIQGQEIPPTIAAVSATPPMVDPETELGGPCSHVHPASKHHNLDRRLENRVGGVSSLGSTVSGVWSHEESLFHINTLECLAVTRSLLKLDPPKDSVILVRTDNTVVVSLINKQGSNKSKVLSRFLHELLALCARNRWTIRSRHLPGHLNTWADSLSRSHPVRAEWPLSPQSFQQLRTHLSPEIDLFAHPGNAKLPAFGCPFPFPSATVVDALATNRNRWKKIYLFPLQT